MKEYPLHFTLSSGTEVIVDNTGRNTYEFTLKHEDGRPTEHFTYVDDYRPKSEWDDVLAFEQLDALRTFWLMNEEVV